MRELYQWGLELRAWKVHEVWVKQLRLDEKSRQIAQIWWTFPANYSGMARKSGSMKERTRTRFKLCLKSEPEKRAWKASLKSAKILYFGHRFFDEIRQIHRIFDAFRQNLQNLWGNQARSKSGAEQKLNTNVSNQVINGHANSFFDCWFSPQSDSLKRFIWRETHLSEL